MWVSNGRLQLGGAPAGRASSAALLALGVIVALRRRRR
jgi:MYXO-CTERM domain-containing protein